MLAIGNDELADLPALGDTVECWLCGERHPVEFGEKVMADGTRQPSKALAVFRCGEDYYLCGIDGRQLRRPKQRETGQKPEGE